jgi:phage terminase large subunit-like protein
VRVVRGDWNKDFLDELQNFPNGQHDDQVDAVSVAWEMTYRAKRRDQKRPSPVRPSRPRSYF